MKSISPRGKSYDDELHEFLLHRFRGYTVTAGSISGYWKAEDASQQYGEHREYKVAFGNEDNISELEAYLSCLAAEIDEKCIYWEIGEEAWLLYAQEARAGNVPV